MGETDGKQRIHREFDLPHFVCRRTIRALFHQFVEEHAVGGRIRQLERIESAWLAFGDGKIRSAHRTDKNFQTSIQVQCEQIRVKTHHERQNGGFQRGFTRTGRPHNQRMPGDSFAQVVLVELAVMQAEVEQRIGQGFERHDG